MLNFNVGRWKRHAIPVIVWLIALLFVGAIFVRMRSRIELTGRVADYKTSVAAIERSTIKTLMVELYEPVKKGQVLAVLDDALLKAELSLVKAELELLQASLQMKRRSAQRKFATDVESTRLEILQLRSEIEPDKISLLDLEYDLKRYTALAKKDAITDEELTKTKYACQALRKKIQLNEERLKQNLADLETKKQRAIEFNEGSEETADGSEINYLRNALNVESLKLQDIQIRLQSLVLKAPINGIVTRIRSRSGDVVEPAEEIFVLVVKKSSEIFSYVSTQQIGELKQGDSIVLQRANLEKNDLQLKINHIGPAVEELPEELWQHPDYPQYGVPVTVTLPEDNDLIPGEIVKLIKK